MKMFKSIFALLFWLLVYAGGGYAVYAYWFMPKYSVQANATPDAPRRAQAVRVISANRSDHTITRVVQARVVARNKGILNFRTAGCISKVHRDPQPGDLLNENEELAVLSDIQEKLEIAEGEAKVTQFLARISEAKVGLGIKIVVSNRSQKALEDERLRYERRKTLFTKGLTTQQVLETAERALMTAQELRDTSSETQALAEAQLSRLSVELSVIEAQLARARIKLTDMALRPSRPVRVLKSNLRVGLCVTPTTAVLDVYEPDSLEINAEVPTLFISKVAEHLDMNALKIGLKLPVSSCAFHISNVEPSIENTNTQIIRIPIPRDCQDQFPHNLSLSLTVPTQKLLGVVQLPRNAERSANTVFVVNDNQLSSRVVKISARDGDWIYVRDGLATGDQVLVSATDLAVEGLKVKVLNP